MGSQNATSLAAGRSRRPMVCVLLRRLRNDNPTDRVGLKCWALLSLTRRRWLQQQAAAAAGGAGVSSCWANRFPRRTVVTMVTGPLVAAVDVK